MKKVFQIVGMITIGGMIVLTLIGSALAIGDHSKVSLLNDQVGAVITFLQHPTQ